MVPDSTKYSKFNEKFNMKNTQFMIEMKFWSFKQFKKVVKNYGIRNRYMVNFKPNSKNKKSARHFVRETTLSIYGLHQS